MAKRKPTNVIRFSDYAKQAGKEMSQRATLPKPRRKSAHDVAAFEGIVAAVAAVGQEHLGWSEDHAALVAQGVFIALEQGVRHG